MELVSTTLFILESDLEQALRTERVALTFDIIKLLSSSEFSFRKGLALSLIIYLIKVLLNKC